MTKRMTGGPEDYRPGAKLAYENLGDLTLTNASPKDDNRDLWLAVRQALLMIVSAIEKKYGLVRK